VTKLTQRGDYTTISQSAIALLIGQGRSLTDIARMLGVTKSYISRVNSGQRALTLEHLAALQEKTGQPIPLLVLNAMPRRSVRPDLLPLYDMTLKLVQKISKPDNKAVLAKEKPISRSRKVRAKAA